MPENLTPERRTVTHAVEVRAAGETAPTTIVGYAALFDVPTVIGGMFVETIAKGAFDGRLEDDVRGLMNHNEDKILGRLKSGTLRLAVDDVGLRYEIDLPNTTVANDLVESMRRGDIDQSSFAFSVADEGDVWNFPPDYQSLPQRTITKVAQLFDVSPVTYPATPSTTSYISARSVAKATEHRQEPPPAPPATQPDLSVESACEYERFRVLAQTRK